MAPVRAARALELRSLAFRSLSPTNHRSRALRRLRTCRPNDGQPHLGETGYDSNASSRQTQYSILADFSRQLPMFDTASLWGCRNARALCHLMTTKYLFDRGWNQQPTVSLDRVIRPTRNLLTHLDTAHSAPATYVERSITNAASDGDPVTPRTSRFQDRRAPTEASA